MVNPAISYKKAKKALLYSYGMHLDACNKKNGIRLLNSLIIELPVNIVFPRVVRMIKPLENLYRM